MQQNINNIKFDFNDISLIPTTISNIRTRKEIITTDENNKIPLFVSPMDTVVDENNYKIFMKLGFYVCIPRGVKNNKLDDECFISFGLDEIENMTDNGNIFPQRILIDVANGHSIRVYEAAKKIKSKYNNVELMIGNIANPDTYKEYGEIGVNYARVGIGSGAACFEENTSINTIKGYKKIKDIKIGDFVLTHTGEYKEVILKHTKKVNSKNLIKINNNISTKDHKYYVLNKKYQNIVNDDNIHEYAEWVKAEKLNKNEYFLLEIEINDLR